MATSYILGPTNSDITGQSGDFSKQLDDTAVGASTLTWTKAATGTEQVWGVAPAGVPGNQGITGDYTVKFNIITGVDAGSTVRVAVRRINSAGVAQATSPFTATQLATAGPKTFTLPTVTLLTWAAGDRLVVIYEWAGGGTMGNVSMGFQVGTTAAEVVAPWTIIPPVAGTLARTQDAQTLAAAGTAAGPSFTGTLAATQAPQTLAAAGTSTPPGVSGSLARAQAGQTLAASGTVTSLGIAGSLSVTQANQTLAAAGVLRYTGTLSQTQAAQTLVAAGWIRVTGTLSVTQAAQTLAAAGGTAQNIGALAVTQAAQTLAASGVLRYTATLAVTQANQTLAAVGVQRYTGTLAAFQAPNTLAASGIVTVIGIAGNLAVTQQNQTLAGVGVLPGYIAFGVNTLSGASSPNGRGSITPGKDARGGTLVSVDYR